MDLELTTKIMIKSYEEMTLSVYERLSALIGEPDNDIDIIALLSGHTTDELLDMPLTEYGRLKDAAAFLAFEPKFHPVQKKYGDLTYLTKIDKLTTAQYIDFKEYIKAQASASALLSVFLIPEGHKYNDGYDIEQVQQQISEMCILDVLALQAFFLNRLGRLTADSLTSLEKILPGMPKVASKEVERLRALVGSGAGFLRLTPFHSLLLAAGLRFTR